MITRISYEFTEENKKCIDFLNYKYFILNKEMSDLNDKSHYSILDLDEKNTKLNQIKKIVAQKRQKYHLISITPSSASGASFAVRDNRIDIIKLNWKLGLKIFNKKYARRIEENKKIIEIDLSLFDSSKLAKDFRPIYRILQTFENSDIQFFLSKKSNNIFSLRSYKGLQSLARLLGITNKSSNPIHLIELLETNKKKLSGIIPFPGVEVIGSQE